MNNKRQEINTLIQENEEVFEDCFVHRPPSSEELKQAEKELGFAVPESYQWFLNQYGHGGYFFEFLGYGYTGNALFVRETMKKREQGLPNHLMVIENCDEYVVCIDTNNGHVVSWSQHDHAGIIEKESCFEDYLLYCVENAIDNYECDDE